MAKDPHERLKTLKKQREIENLLPEDAVPLTRPTDRDLYNFLEQFTDDYSWREDILSDKMNVNVFEYDTANDSYTVSETEQEKYNIFRWLRDKKYLQFDNNQDGTITVFRVNEDSLYKLMNELHPDIQPATVTYSPSSKIVIFNGKQVGMYTGESHTIFHLLASRPNERISKEAIWRAIGKRAKLKREKDKFSILIDRVRTSVGANKKEINLKGSVTLHANVKIID